MKPSIDLLAVAGAAMALAACTGGMHKQAAEARAAVTITHDDVTPQTRNQVTRQAGIDCIPGRRGTVEVEITGRVAPPTSDTIIGEALCEEHRVARAQATAQPPIGFDSDRGSGKQAEGIAICQASWTVAPGPNAPVWKVVCRFD